MVAIADLRGIATPDPVTGKYSSASRTDDGDWRLDDGHYEGHAPMTLLSPRPDSETFLNERHRTNYPGQKYRVSIDIADGKWPYHFEISGPPGMTIGNDLEWVNGELVAGENYGVISWDNPLPGVYDVVATATEQGASPTIITVAYRLVVDAADWLFVNPQAGANGNGTLESPYNTLVSLAGKPTKNVLFMEGEVDWEQKTIGLQNMPKVYLTYNEAEVIMWQALSPIGSNLSGGFYFGGFTFKIPEGRNNVDQFFRLDGATRTKFYENIFDFNSVSNSNLTPENSSVLFWQNRNVAESSSQNARYCVIKSNAFKNIKDRDIWLGYSMLHTLIENNSFENCEIGVSGMGHGLYAKTNVKYLCVRGNYSIGNTNTQKLLRTDSYVGNFPVSHIYTQNNSYKYYGVNEGAIAFAHEFHSGGSDRVVFRNNLYAEYAASVYLRGMAAGDVVTLSNNVLVCNGDNVNGVKTDQFQGTVNNTGFIAGDSSDGILNSNNKFTQAYIENLGLTGAQVA